jgi:hypothetical protein
MCVSTPAAPNSDQVLTKIRNAEDMLLDRLVTAITDSAECQQLADLLFCQNLDCFFYDFCP